MGDILLPLISLFKDKILEKDINEALKVKKEHKLRRSDIIDIVKNEYLNQLSADKEYAMQLRQKFLLTVTEIGIFTWLFYEIMGFAPKN